MGSSGDVENMEKDEKTVGKSEREVNLDKWMKPFGLGWRREVVLRLITGSNYCDIYYFHPSGKKLRSLTEVKANLTDDLTPDCFCFKKMPLYVSSETIRNAADRSGVAKKPKIASWEEARDRNQLRLKGKESDKSVPLSRLTRRQLMKRKKEQQAKVLEANKLRKTRRVPGKKIMKKTGEKGLDGLASDLYVVRKMSLKARPKILRSTMVVCRRRKTAREADGVKKRPVGRKRLNQPEMKKFLNGDTRRQLKKEQERTVLEVRKVRNQRRVTKKGQTTEKVGEDQTETSIEEVVTENNSAQSNEVQSAEQEPDSPSEMTKSEKGDCIDIRSIVQRNIGKYREMRKRQINEGLTEKTRKKIPGQNVPRQRYEPVSKKLDMYLIPLERGWRRELVHRVNGPDAAGRSDVYYFHPNGKRLRSAREIANHLTHGLTLEYFTFRKEALGCGEPFETIRNARLNKSQEQKTKKESL